jgi:hypothetical protein
MLQHRHGAVSGSADGTSPRAGRAAYDPDPMLQAASGTEVPEASADQLCRACTVTLANAVSPTSLM